MADALPELKISCTDSNCEEDLHCFRPRRQEDKAHPVCRDCGADLVDWEIVHRRDLSRISSLISELPKELIRHHYWHMEIPAEIRAKALRVSPETLASRTRKAIAGRVSAPSSQIWRDGTQTPAEHSGGAQIYFFGMHAVAACCRKCMEYWHGIDREQVLSEDDQHYFQTLVWYYVCLRLGQDEWIGLIDHVD